MIPIERDALKRRLVSLIAKMKAATPDDRDVIRLSRQYFQLLIETMERARDALDGSATGASEVDLSPAVCRAMAASVPLPTNEEISDRYRNIPQPPTALERLVFDTTVVDPVQGEALRALLEGRPPVPVVTQ